MSGRRLKWQRKQREMNLNQLRIGDIVRNIGSGNTYEIVIIDSGRILAIREIEISNPDEWVAVGRPGPQFSRVALYLSVWDDLPHLLNLIQSNQDFFGNPPAGESCIKLAADKLEELIKAGK